MPVREINQVDVQVWPDRLLKLLGIKGPVPFSLVPQIIPILDFEKYIGALQGNPQPTQRDALWFAQTAGVNAAGDAANELIVPTGERWTIYAVSAYVNATNPLAADQRIRMQPHWFVGNPAIGAQRAPFTDTVTLDGAAGDSVGGIGLILPTPVELHQNGRVGLTVSQITVGAAGSIDVELAILRFITSTT